MLINFNEMLARIASGMNGGTGEMTAKMYMSERCNRCNPGFCNIPKEKILDNFGLALIADIVGRIMGV